MRKLNVVLAAPMVVILAAGIVAAQVPPAQSSDSATVAEPALNDVFYQLESGKLVPLERLDTGTTRVSMGFGNMKGTTEFPGGKSPVRFRNNERLDFIVRSGSSAAQDPATVYHLRVLTSKKNKRAMSILAVSSGLFSGTSKTGAALGEVPLEFTRYGSASVKASTPALPPGEYAVGTGIPGQSAFCFGVD